MQYGVLQCVTTSEPIKIQGIRLLYRFDEYASPSSSEQGGNGGDSDIDLADLSESDNEEDDEYDEILPFKPLKESQPPVAVPLPDMVLQPSFDSDNPAYRFQFLEPTSQFLNKLWQL
ncbi:hypothetical protein L1887_20778 [Cichorium endivia]|nr:hypothetical protein L1887_20778 [Cichorium endivia]